MFNERIKRPSLKARSPFADQYCMNLSTTKFVSIYSKFTFFPKVCFNEVSEEVGWEHEDWQFVAFSFVFVEQQLSLLLVEQQEDYFGAFDTLVLLISVIFFPITSELSIV